MRVQSGCRLLSSLSSTGTSDIKNMPVAARRHTNKRTAGRPRCQVAREAILSATVRLLNDHPLRDLAIESIAREAGVGKATIYRWWATKADIVIDAFFSEAAPLTEFTDGENATEIISQQCARLVDVMNGPLGRVVAQIIAEGQANDAVLSRFREVFLNARRTEFRLVYARGVANNEFRDDIEVELAADLVYGPIWYRLMVAHQPLDRTFAESLPKLAIAALGNA